MINRRVTAKRWLVLPVALLALLVAGLGIVWAATGPVNGGFETGDLTGWNTVIPGGGFVTVVGAADGNVPISGSFFARIKTDGPGSNTRLFQSVTVVAGETISGSAYFRDVEFEQNQPCQFDDEARVLVAGATVFFAKHCITGVGNNATTPWTVWSHTFGAAGTFAIEARLHNGGDPVVDSFMGLDDVHFTNQAPDCSTAAPSESSLWPPNHKFVPISVVVSDPDGDAISINIVSIFQDEALNGQADGNTSIDGQGVGSSTAEVRAERSGKGDGRVYHISYTASDGSASCSGEVLVGVPHDQGNGSTPVDGGALVDSTTP